jgi:predicted nucleotidyltransferase
MRPRNAVLRRYLDHVFAAPSHVAILRALQDAAEGMSGRQVARQAGINHQTCAVALGRLEELGVILRRGAGQSQLFQLNRTHRIVQDLLLPLFRQEREVYPRVLQRVGELVSGRCMRALVFGSVARGEERRDSDLDLLLIAGGPGQSGAARQAAADVRAAIGREWGLRANPIVLTERAVAERRARQDPLIASILLDGVEIDLGKPRRRRNATHRATAAR